MGAGLGGHRSRRARYTNHTLLPEALEKWPLPLFGALLPRHLEIIYEINRRFLDGVRLRHPGDDGLRRAAVAHRRSAAAEYVRMAHLAAVGSHAINGVAALHTELLQQTVLRDFHAVAPEKFLNVTNGVTPRRWMALGNPRAERAHHPPHRRSLDRAPRRGAARGSSRWPAMPASRRSGAPSSRRTSAASPP